MILTVFLYPITIKEPPSLFVKEPPAVKVDASLVVRNWLFGWYIVEFENGAADRSELYGKKLIDNLSRELSLLGVTGTSPTNLRKSRQFYQSYQTHALPDGIQQTPSVISFDVAEPEIQQALSVISPSTLEGLMKHFSLGWSHYVEILTLNDPNERSFYEIEASSNSWSVKELKRQIESSLYQRLALSRDKEEIRKLATQGLVVEKAADVIKNPYILEFLGLDERHVYSENELESAIIDKLESFLLELGKGFLFEARQKRFTFDNDHFYIDLVFYNRLLRCYVLIDLKRDKLTHQDLGQMQMYVSYFDRYVKTTDEAFTIGIVLCHRKNDALVELTLPAGSNIYASEYQLYLPSKEELRQKLVDWTAEMEIVTKSEAE